MNRRDFFRALGWCAAAVVAGEPIAKAWAAALARHRPLEYSEWNVGLLDVELNSSVHELRADDFRVGATIAMLRP